jgi:hypothetical protein
VPANRPMMRPSRCLSARRRASQWLPLSREQPQAEYGEKRT